MFSFGSVSTAHVAAAPLKVMQSGALELDAAPSPCVQAPVGGASTPAFGAASTPSLFGAASSAAAGGFGASPSPFMSTPAFGAPASSASLFGEQGGRLVQE